MAFGSTELQILINAKDEASGTFKKVGGVVGKFAKVAAVGVGALGVAAGAATVAAVKMAAGYEAAMKEVASLGVPAKQMKVLEKGVLDLSRRLGVDATEATGALYQAISAGVPPENALAFLETASKAAIAGVTDAETAVDGISSVVNAFASQNITATEAADLMFATVKAGKTNFEELSASIANVAPLANATGVQFSEVSAALATMTASGTATAVATTQIRSAIQALTKPSEELNQIFTAAGFASGEAAVRQLGFAKAAAIVSEATGGSVSQMTKLLGSIEGVQGVLGVTGDQADAFAANIEGMAKSAGAADQAFDVMSKSFDFQMGRVRESFKTGLIEVGLQILPIIAPIAAMLADKLPAAIGFVVEKVQSFIEVIGKLTNRFGQLKGDMHDFGGVLQEQVLPALAPFISLIEATIQMLGSLAKPLMTVIDALGEALAPVIEMIFTEMLPPFLELLGELATQFESQLLPLIQEVVEALADVLVPAFQLLGDIVIWIMRNVTLPLWAFLKTYIIPIFVKVAEVLLTVLRDALRVIAKLLRGDFMGAFEAAWQLVSNLVGGVSDLFGRMRDAAIGAVNGIIGAVRRMAREVASAVRNVPVVGGVIGKLAGFQEGGQFMVGGAGGPDSQTVAFRATPGETVTVTKPGQGVGGGGFSPTIVVQGSLISERELSEVIVESMREATRLNQDVLDVNAVAV